MVFFLNPSSIISLLISDEAIGNGKHRLIIIINVKIKIIVTKDTVVYI